MKGSPNENFARELMELFTLGVGNYSEADVAAAARAWTGHNYDYPTATYLFRPTRHDTGNKTFFGTTKNWDGPEIINEILATTRRSDRRGAVHRQEAVGVLRPSRRAGERRRRARRRVHRRRA